MGKYENMLFPPRAKFYTRLLYTTTSKNKVPSFTKRIEKYGLYPSIENDNLYHCNENHFRLKGGYLSYVSICPPFAHDSPACDPLDGSLRNQQRGH